MRFAVLMAIAAVVLVACGPLSTSEPAMPSPGEPDTNIPTVTDDCPHCILVQDVMEEFKANPLRANRTYRDTRHTVGGVIEDIGGGNAAIGFERGPVVTFTNGVRVTLAWDEAREWGQKWDWLMENNIGDSIRVDCRINMLDGNESGMPNVVDCVESAPLN